MLYSNTLLFIEQHDSEIPWLKIFTQKPHKEFSDCSLEERTMIFEMLDLIEKEMISYFQPDKINLASFGNMLPHVHWHIMARFCDDSYFPEPMWGSRQREGSANVAPMEPFLERVKEKLVSRFG